MKLTKLFIPILAAGILFSCSKEELTIDETGGVDSLDLVANLGTYENSSLGMYKGVFSTTDSQDRGVVEIKVINDEIAKATITYLNGDVEFFNGAVRQQEGLTINNGLDVLFNTRNSSFAFSVNADGSNPTVTNANSNSRASVITVVKENQRGAVTPLTGSYISEVGGTGTWSILFNSGTGEGDDTDITTQSLFDGTDFGSATGNAQDNCVTIDNETTCDVGGMYTSGGFDIVWSGVHTYLGTPDCSSSTGTWTASGGGITSSGTYVTDLICTAPGNFLETAIPITPSAEGTGCAVTSFTVNLTDDGYSNSGIDNSGCTAAPSVGSDIFYTWTSTTDALFFQADQTSADEDIVIRDAMGTIIECALGSSFGGTTLSGWTVGDDLIIQIIGTNDTADFCLEVATIPGAPANDLCMDATPIACGESDSGSTLTATDETGATGNDVFYSFTNSGMLDQTVTVSLCGSAYDTRVRILDGCGGTQIAQNDDNSGACGPGGNSQVDFTAVVGQSYIIVVEAFSTQSGTYNIAVTCEDIVPPPPTECGSSLVDNGGVDGNYENSSNETITITAGVGEFITLDFSVFDLENNFDFLQIFDGPDAASPEITTSVGGATAATNGFTNTSLNGDSVVSTGETITVVFTSDGSVNDIGYVADVICSPLPPTRGLQQTMTLQERNARPELSIERQLELKIEALEKYNR